MQIKKRTVKLNSAQRLRRAAACSVVTGFRALHRDPSLSLYLHILLEL